MDVYEQLTYIPRLTVIFFATIILVIIFSFARPDLPGTNDLRADALTGVVAHASEYFVEPGIIEEDKFRQEAADKLLMSKSQRPVLVFIKATLYADDQKLRTITYNQQAHTVLGPQVGVIDDVKCEVRRLPVTVRDTNTDVPGMIELEACYEE